MKKQITTTFAIILGLFLAISAVQAQNRGFRPGKPGHIPPPFDDFTTLIPGACNSCGTSMAGDWTYTMHNDEGGIVVATVPITFAQYGAYFWGQSANHTIIGEVKGKWIQLTLTVSGEEGLGWVSKAEGSIHSYPEYGGFTLGTMVTQSSTGASGSLILRRPPF